MPDIDLSLKKKIMRRVYAIWLFREITSPFALEIISCLVLFFWMTRYISPINILRNAPSLFSLGSAGDFLTVAFYNTEFIVQIMLLIFIFPLLLLLKDVKMRIEQIILH